MPKKTYEVMYEVRYRTTVTVDEDAGETLDDKITDIDIPFDEDHVGSQYCGDSFEVLSVTDKETGQRVEFEQSDGPCDECGADIPEKPGGSISNKHHDPSCSLYDPDKD